MNRDLIDLERSSRSVFVGNIPYEATEESLRDIFSEVGPVVSFRLVFDRESGKPKGYGFAEYQDQETAMSAMRNLNNRELHGRSLRVDHATSEKNRIMEDLSHMGGGGPPRERPFGEPVPSRDAPEAISKAVASLPPEQMFELMKQMKQCIQNNPVEARNMLLQNPQLAYALLQAQVVMRIVDPEIAMKMLHRQNPVPNLIPAGEPLDRPPMDGRPNGEPPGRSPYGNREPPPRRMVDDPMDIPRRRDGSPPPRMLPRRGPPDDRMPMDVPMDRGRGEPMGMGPRDHPMDRRGPPMGPRGDRDRGRRSPEQFGRGPYGREFPDRGGPMDGIPGMGGLPMDRGPMDRGPPMDRGHMDRGPPMDHGGPPRDRGGPPFHDRGPPGRMMDQRGGSMERNNPSGPNRDRGPSLERGAGDPRRGLGPQSGPPGPSAPSPSAGGAVPAGVPDPNNPDQEKAALIMQVLQLTPEQIAMLPEEQRKSIMILKEQITGGRQ